MRDDTSHLGNYDTPVGPRRTLTVHGYLKGKAVCGSPTALKPPSTLVQNHPDDVAPVRNHKSFALNVDD